MRLIFFMFTFRPSVYMDTCKHILSEREGKREAAEEIMCSPIIAPSYPSLTSTEVSSRQKCAPATRSSYTTLQWRIKRDKHL